MIITIPVPYKCIKEIIVNKSPFCRVNDVYILETFGNQKAVLSNLGITLYLDKVDIIGHFECVSSEGESHWL